MLSRAITNWKSHTPFRLVPKSTTFDDLERPVRTLLQKRCVAGVPCRRGSVKRQWGCRRQFSAFSLAISSETLEIRSALLYSDTQSVVSFSVISKCVTLNDPEWLFRVKFCFAPVCLASDRATFENNCVKTNKDRHTVSRANLRRNGKLWFPAV